jgi:hypothetical protein
MCGKSERERPLERHEHRWENHIEVEITRNIVLVVKWEAHCTGYSVPSEEG